MSKIRQRVLAGQGAHGTVTELGDWLVESIRQLTPDEKVQCRAEMNRKFQEHADRELIARPCNPAIQ
ncbi:MAG TPA: hypothetical protein VOA88_01130 [Candidatus Dormibacteraeota bacterium]|nr:hypothetical protein [Candidatus Dormibacteraeota bacterium]